MARSPLFGRRIHISGSVVDDLMIASTADVEAARELIATLVKELVKRGANFVIPIDAEPRRKVDGLPVCFDWLVLETVRDNLKHRPHNAPEPFIVAVQHHKTEEQIPNEYLQLWDELLDSQLIKIDNAAYWNMNSKRMEGQARFGDALIALGGDEGVLYLANLYHDAGKPIVPLNLALCATSNGSRRLYALGLASDQTRRLFQTADNDPHDWINRISFPKRQSIPDRVSAVIDLLESLDRPKAFAVRLLDPEHNDYATVQNFFDDVAKPVLEDELGYSLIVIDGTQSYEYSRIDQEIFAKLHRSSIVIADITGSRPNCFLELGYALGRGLPTMVTARDGATLPFDIATFAGHHWKENDSVDDRRRAFREHWNAIRNRPPLVPAEPLIS